MLNKFTGSVIAALIMGANATQVTAAEISIDGISPVTAEMLLNPPAEDWLMWRRTYDGWGYSPLDQINKANVKDLKLAWAWGMSPGGRSQETPIVHDGIMYIQNSTHLIQALNAATGDLIWEYQHELADGVNPSGERSKAIYEDKLIISTRDAKVFALDTKTGKLIWETVIADHTMKYAASSGAMVADGVVIQGTTGCGGAQPGGCFFTGLDANTGEKLWTINTIARGDTPEGNSWNGIPLENRHGGSAWISGAYDPKQNLVFAGVGQPYPWIAEMNGLLPPSADKSVTNKALYTDSTLAIVPKTGELKWYHQYLETDSLDLDYVYDRLLIDNTVNGVVRQQVVTAGKLGIVESLDRTSGEWLWAKETVPQNVVLSIDQKTGEKTINPATVPHMGETTFNCPADPGGRAWQAFSYSPRTEALYMPLVEFCSNTTPQPLDPGEKYTGGGRATFDRVRTPDSDGNIGRVDAMSMKDQSTLWSHRQYAPITSSTLPTAGGVVFVGTLDRKFLAMDDQTGEVLWSSGALSNALESFPISYSAGGKQFVAITASWASGLGRLQSLVKDIKLPKSNPAMIYVFALPG